MDTRGKIRKILRLIDKAYGPRAPLKKTNPVDELIRTILSQNTNDKNSLPAYAILKLDFKTWEDVLKTPAARIERLIKNAGLAKIKAARIKNVLAEIKRREGRINLSNLARLDVKKSLEYLISLKGVGPKTASCILLFSFARAVMPVDTHIFRVTKRLGLIAEELTISEAHTRLSVIVPKDLIYAFHLGIIEHGRKTCKAQNPACGVCVLYKLCRFKGKEKQCR